MAIITVSQQLGSGRRIGESVAERLGYQCVGSEILAKAAREYGLVRERLHELGEAKPAILDRLEAETQIYIAVIQNAVVNIALQDDIVLVGRGGQWLLRGIPHVLRVRIVAAFEERVRRLAADVPAQGDRRDGVETARAAIRELLRRDDADKRGRMRYLYDRDVDDPELYDLVANATRDGLDVIVDGIVALARHPTFITTDEGRRRLSDRALASRARVALLLDERTRNSRHPTIDAQAGTVRITSTAPRGVVDDVVRSVPGVQRVHVDEVSESPVTSLWHVYRTLIQ